MTILLLNDKTMKFYCIIEKDDGDSQKRYLLLEASCKKRNIDFVKVVPEEFNYTNFYVEKNSILYRATPGRKSRIIEKWIASKSITFYKDTFYLFNDKSSSFFSNKASNLPIIETVPDFLSNFDLIENYVNFVGGFPLIIKITGKSHGVGVVKVDSMDALKSFSDYLKTTSENIVMRKFIQHKKQGRLIVIGDKVIASHVNYCDKDFRSNVGDDKERMRDPIVFPENVQEIAIRAVKSVGLEFGGVDILFEEETNNPYIAEVNFPCFFPTTQYLTNIDIAGQMIDFLINKSKDKNLTK